MLPLLKGLIWGVAGFLIGAGLTLLVRLVQGLDAISFGPVVVIGYIFGLTGWLLGAGVWDAWAKGWLGRSLQPYRAKGWRQYFSFNTDHKVIGIQYLVTFVVIFLLAAAFAMLFRAELMYPGRQILGPAGYNHIVSIHGMMMIAVAIAVITGSFGNYFVPLMIGARDMAFPRLNALSYWLTPPVAVLLLATFLAGGWDTGWTGYPPLSELNKPGQILYNLAFFTLGLSSILGSINFLATIFTMRAPGMKWGRLPIFVWSIFSTSILGLIFTQFVAAVMTMVLLDRIAGMGFFNPDLGGDPLLYQHLFWFYSHPAVYIMMLPGLGIFLEVITHFSRKPLFAYWWAVAGFLGITTMSAVVWGHHMFSAGVSTSFSGIIMATTEIISIPTGLVFLSALGTIWRGRLWLRTPMLFALAVAFNFLIGGLSGIFQADVPTDLHLHDTYFVVAHFHYTIFGGEIFALFAGIYYWFPKITGKMYSERLAKLHFWWMFLAFNATFLPMFYAGLHGANRRIADYLPDLAGIMWWEAFAAFVLGASFIIFVYNMIHSWRRGPAAEANPWQARTLEWQTSSPPMPENFTHIPQVVGHPYDYGIPDSVHAIIPPAGSASDEKG
ncbi:MAG: cbb3-type cytochrome c oxidase subunit I [Dehalococcoidales bacterium]|nr:cbb3-type cytochrome c oxidase subunit I [Dehalococcoidales bacterium]